MKNSAGRVLYIGKAGNLRRRVSSYLERPAPFAQGLRMARHDLRIEKLVSEISKVDYEKTDTAIEALILEAKLIKKLAPPYNVREKDDKSFLYVEITREKFPRVLLARGKEKPAGARFGPFISASNVREAMKILRRIFPWSTHLENEVGRRRPCLDYEIGLCPGTCVGAVSREEYLKNIRNLKLFFFGKKKKIISNLESEMKTLSRKLDFERAAKIRGRLFALKHIRDAALIGDERPSVNSGEKAVRIEGYDISDISGDSAVGSMVVFINCRPSKNDYRKFKIKTLKTPDDVGMMKEVINRRLKNNWPLPHLVLVDGGRGQVNAIKSALDKAGLKIPVVGMVKGPERKRTDVIGRVPRGIDLKTLIRVRDEAHRFAIAYHKKLRGIRFFAR